MKHTKSSVFLLPIFLLIGCKAENEFDTFPQRIDARTFSVHTPQNWNLYEDSGIDTYVGRITGPSDIIYFDQGYLSFGGLENVNEGEHTLLFQRLEIDQVPSILHKERRVGDSDGDVRLSVYIDAGDEKKLNRLYVFDPEDEEQIIKIFRSHKFK